MTEWATEFPPTFDVGDPSAGHEHFDADGVKFYAPDGVTVVFSFNNATGELDLTGVFVSKGTGGNQLEIGTALRSGVPVIRQTTNGTPGGELWLGALSTLLGLFNTNGNFVYGIDVERNGTDDYAVYLGAGGQAPGEINTSEVYRWKGTPGGADETAVPVLAGKAESLTVTLDANGEYTWTHNLGITPSFVSANWGRAATLVAFETGAYSTTQAVIRGFTDTGARAAGANGTVHLLAVA